MIVIVSLLFFVVLLFTKTDEDGYKDSLVPVISSKSLNGFFTCLILISHFIGYVELHDIEFQVGKLITNYIGQLMVASFLFFSGYGIYSGIKKNDSYITNKFPTRFCRVYFNFFISVCIYIVYNFLVGHVFSINTTLLAFTGWESIGNSNWYIFTILVMYLIVYGIFNNDNDLDKNLFRFTLVVVIYGLIISRIKENFWVSTVLCFPAGMILKENENIISNFLNCKRRYILSICVLLSLIFLIYSLFGYSWIVYNFISILFILILIFLNKLYRLRNIVFIYISKYTFEIYIYQRIFFDLFRNMFAGKNVAIYFVTSVILTIIFSIVIKKTVDIMYRKLIGE